MLTAAKFKECVEANKGKESFVLVLKGTKHEEDVKLEVQVSSVGAAYRAKRIIERDGKIKKEGLIAGYFVTDFIRRVNIKYYPTPVQLCNEFIDKIFGRESATMASNLCYAIVNRYHDCRQLTHEEYFKLCDRIDSLQD